VNTIRPDLIGPVQYVDQRLPNGLIQWFNPAVCDPLAGVCPAGASFGIPIDANGVAHFGDMRRNSVYGPGFNNVDFSLTKNTKITERLSAQLRAEAFDVLNHPNFGQPGRVALPGSTAFGVISSTRFPTGDSGSSRQLQFAVKLMF
jgi:hypothetical protein